ncbi:MAG TPA: hypothetical protein VFD48_16480 [Pyrinomonadaceae bacterium]|nr:hypothetical protein [Pyrinomonadaceae bacterium]
MSSAETKTKRKVVLLGLGVLIVTSALFTLWYFPTLTLHRVSIACGPNNSSSRWQTILGISVYESMVAYHSEEEARGAFENEIARFETIIERTKNPVGFSNVYEEVVGTFINSESRRRFCIIRLRRKDIYRTYAPSLRYALAFDRFRGREGYLLATPSDKRLQRTGISVSFIETSSLGQLSPGR